MSAVQPTAPAAATEELFSAFPSLAPVLATIQPSADTGGSNNAAGADPGDNSAQELPTQSERLSMLEDWAQDVDDSLKSGFYNAIGETWELLSYRVGHFIPLVLLRYPCYLIYSIWAAREDTISDLDPAATISKPLLESLANDKEVIPVCALVLKQHQSNPEERFMALRVLWGTALPDLEFTSRQRVRIAQEPGLVDSLVRIVTSISAPTKHRYYAIKLLFYLASEVRNRNVFIGREALVHDCLAFASNERVSKAFRSGALELLPELLALLPEASSFVDVVVKNLAPTARLSPASDSCTCRLGPAIWTSFAGTGLGNAYDIVDIPESRGYALAEIAGIEECAVPLFRNSILRERMDQVRFTNSSGRTSWPARLVIELASAKGYEAIIRADMTTKSEIVNLIKSRVIPLLRAQMDSEYLYDEREGFQDFAAATYDDIFRECLVEDLQTWIDYLQDALDYTHKTVRLAGVLGLANLVGADSKRQDLLRDVEGMYNYLIFQLKGRVQQDLQVTGFSGRAWKTWQILGAMCNLCMVKKHRDFLAEQGVIPLLAKAVRLPVVTVADKWAYENGMATLTHFTLDTDYAAQVRLAVNFGELSSSQSFRRVAEVTTSMQSLVTEGLDSIAANAPKPAPEVAAKAQRTVMLSYNWGSKPTAQRIEAFLNGNGYDVWRDEGSLSGNLIEGMAKAVLRCDVIIVLLSDGYARSTNCQLEAKYASRVAARENQTKKVIPLVVEPKFDITRYEWLDFLFGGVLYYNVTNNFESTMASMLSKELQRRSILIPQATNVVSTPFTSPVRSESASSPKPSSSHEVVVVQIDDSAPPAATASVMDEVNALIDKHKLRDQLAKFGFATLEELSGLMELSPKDAAEVLETEPSQRAHLVVFLTALRKILAKDPQQ